jgi:predicted O-methyltransferase YrrM
MQRSSGRVTPSALDGSVPLAPADSVPVLNRPLRHPVLLSSAARRAARQHMLQFRPAAVERVATLTGAGAADLKRYRRDLLEHDLVDTLLHRGAGPAFARELPQAGLLYLLVRALRPRRVVETGVRPGYSTAWLLAGLDDNEEGELTSLGPGPTAGRATSVADVTVGQFVAPSLRRRWTLVLGNTEEHFQSILSDGPGIDLFLFDNGPEVQRARFELRLAWGALSEQGILLAHHTDANSAWLEFCRMQGAPPQLLDAGPPPMGVLSMRPPRR